MIRHPTNGSILRWAAAALLVVLFGTLHVSEAGGGSVSKRPDQQTDKAKIQMLQSYAVATKRDPSQADQTTVIEPDGGICPVGELLSNKCKVHPLVVSYMEEDEPGLNRFDIYAAVSLDEGNTWKRINLSNNVKRSSTYHGRRCFTKEGGDDGDDHHSGGGRFLHDDGDDGHGEVEFTFSSDNFKPMIVAKGNLVLVAWTSRNCKGGVPGNQGDGEGPYGGDQDDHDPHNKLGQSDGSDKYQVKGRQNCHDYSNEGVGMEEVAFKCVWAARGQVGGSGEIKWTKPERITSGRRDAFQLTAQVAGNKAAWALAWQEDPKGLRVGEAAGPGDGMSGATVNHKTDIWYSYLLGADFTEWESDGSSNRFNIKDGARFSTPVRVTDNAACKVEYDENGGIIYKGGPYCEEHCDSIMDFPEAKVPGTCVTADEIPLNGDTGASRPNMFLIPEGKNGARVVLAYEESKGLGKGPGDNHDETGDTTEPADREDWGKNIYYHTFPFRNPEVIAHGTRINLPQLVNGFNPTLTEDGTEFLTLNARRVRIIQQPPSKWGDGELAMALLYREGEEGHGHPAHITMRRFIGGYEPENLECTKTRKHPQHPHKHKNENVCVEGSTDLNKDNTPDPEPDSLDDARAHRGFLRGDFLVVGYTYAPKWGRGFPKRYDFFVRRSFDAGKKWTNSKGIKEDPVNLSNLKEEGNRGWSVTEPRIYATPGTINKDNPASISDVQNTMVYFAAFSTTHNPHPDDTDAAAEGPPINEKDSPMDLFWTMTDNFGDSYMKVWNDEASKWQYPWFAKVKGPDDDAGFDGAQIRTNPAGTKVFASFQANKAGDSFLEQGGGPCRGNGRGSDVCSNSTVIGDRLLLKYDINGDGKVDDSDVQDMTVALRRGQNPPMYDLNGDGTVTGIDKFLLLAAEEEFKKRPTDLRRAYLRGRE